MSSPKELYEKRYKEQLLQLSDGLEAHLKKTFCKSDRIDRISVRPKSIESFVEKSQRVDEKGLKVYDAPLDQIQDQIGARIVAFYLDDVKSLESTVNQHFRKIEDKNLFPNSDYEFGYFGKHYILFLPSHLTRPEIENDIPPVFELQIKTLFQHAWSEANHDLGYKPGGYELKSDDNRRLAFTAAQAWGADQIFNELYGRKIQQEKQ